MSNKVHFREGKSPDQKLRILRETKCKGDSRCNLSQDVRLEAANIEGKRNSSLVEQKWVENKRD